MAVGSTYVPFIQRRFNPDHFLTEWQVERLLGTMSTQHAEVLRKHIEAAEALAYDAGKAASRATGQTH